MKNVHNEKFEHEEIILESDQVVWERLEELEEESDWRKLHQN